MEGLNRLIKQAASENGFSACGITRAEAMPELKERYLSWTGRGFHGEMHYLGRDPGQRTDPTQVMEGARTVICLAMYYQPDPALVPAAPFRIARFALGKDYHAVLKEKMETLAVHLGRIAGPFRYRTYVDAGPLAEKAIAARSGIGWMGKNTLLQVRGKGTWFLLGEILTDLDLEPDLPSTGDHCGNCNRCIDACPAGALTAPFTLDARRCLSYLTIETKGPFSPETRLHGQLYGCDICQEVCPYNHFLQPLRESFLEPDPRLRALERDDWSRLDQETFLSLFRQSGVKRLGFERLVRNLRQTLKNP